jgi:hypothetical protein
MRRVNPFRLPRQRVRPEVEILEDRLALDAQAIGFTIDPASSSLSLSGTLATPLGSRSVVEQGTGSLTTSFTGSIGTVIDFAASSILFREAGTSLNAAVSGSWSPRPGGLASTAPADYGGKFDATVDTVFVALHDTAGTLPPPLWACPGPARPGSSVPANNSSSLRARLTILRLACWHP